MQAGAPSHHALSHCHMCWSLISRHQYPTLLFMQAEAHSSGGMPKGGNPLQQSLVDAPSSPPAATSSPAAVVEPSSSLSASLSTSSLHSTQKWVDISWAPSAASSTSAAAANSMSSSAQMPPEADSNASPASADTLLTMLMAYIYLSCLIVAIVLYFITGDAGFFMVPSMIHCFMLSSALHLEKTAATTKRQLVDQMRSWLAQFTLTAIRNLLSDAVAAVSTAVAGCKSTLCQLKHDYIIAISKCKSTMTQLRQDYPSYVNTLWMSVKHLGVSMQSTGRTGIANIKNAACRSLRALHQLAASTALRSLRALCQSAASLEQMYPGIFIFVFSLITATTLLTLEDSYPLQALQVLLSACTIAVMLAALCELSGSRDIFILAIVSTVMQFSIQTAMCAVSTATHPFGSAALRKALLPSNTAKIEMAWCNSKISSLASAFMAWNVVPVSKSRAQKHSEPDNSQQAFTFAASPVSEIAADTTTPVLAVSKRPTAAMAASEPLPPTSQVNTDAYILPSHHSCCT